MCKILMQQFVQILEYDVVKNRACIEIEFCIDNDPEYDSCWLGKTYDKKTKKARYWYGLVSDGSQSGDFNGAENFLDAKIFNGISLKDIWAFVTLYSIDGCSVDERLSFYLELKSGPRHGCAINM